MLIQFKMKTKILATSLFLMLQITVFADISDEIANIIRSANAKGLAAHFDESVDLKILDQENVYSKAQAELIVKDFFTKYAVKSFSINHKSAPKNGSEYAIGTLQTSNGTFRTYFLLKKEGDKVVIQQFRIEPENEQ